MDPMDFTMDDGQGSQQHNSAGNQYHCQGSLQYSYHTNGNHSMRGMPMRGEGQPYDPVHDNSGSSWYSNRPNFPGNQQAHSSYPHSEHTFGGNYHNLYPPAHDNSRMQALAYQQYNREVMGRRDGLISPAGWIDRSGQHNRFNQTYSNYSSSTMNSNLDTSGQNVLVSQGPPASSNPYLHSTAQRQEYQAARVDQENIRNSLNAPYSGAPAAIAVSQEPRLQQQSRVRPIPHANYHAGPSSRPAYQPHRPDATTVRNERTQAAQQRASMAAATAAAAAIRARTYELTAVPSEDDDDDVVSPGTSPGVRYRHADHYLFAAEQAEERLMVVLAQAQVQAQALAHAQQQRTPPRPSKEALASLIKTTVEEVKAEGKEIHCIICYNNFGEPNPENITEEPLKLPKCGHVFGNICIRVWFESHDTCPYCRDKLPAETVSRRTLAIEQYRMLQERMLSAHSNENGRAAHVRARSTLAFRSSAVDSAANYAARLANERSAEPAYSSPSRASTNESPDRRRPTRARPLSGRPSQPVFTRSLPAARVVSQRAMPGSGSPGLGRHPSFTGSPYRGMPTAHSDTSSAVPQNQPSVGSGSGVAAEEASPAVADGSLVSTGDRMPEPGMYTGNFAFSEVHHSQINQSQNSLPNVQTAFSSADLPLHSRTMNQHSVNNSSRDNAARSTQGPNITNMPPAESMSSNAPTTPHAERDQASGNPASLPSNFRPRWTR